MTKVLRTVQAVRYVARNAEKHMYFVERCLKQNHMTAHSDYGHRSGCPVSVESVTWKTVKRFRWTRNVNIPKFIRQSTVVTETSMKGVSETLSVSLYMLIPETCITKCNIL